MQTNMCSIYITNLYQHIAQLIKLSTAIPIIYCIACATIPFRFLNRIINIFSTWPIFKSAQLRYIIFHWILLLQQRLLTTDTIASFK